MSPPRYGVLLVTGNHTHQENYAEAFAADKRCRLIAVTDEAKIPRRRLELNQRLAKTHRIPYIADLAKALADKDVNIVSICTEPERRGRIALQCAQARKHLYLDKSLAPSLEEADQLLAAVRKAKVRSHMFSFISQPWAQEAKAWINNKCLGRLLAIHADTFFAKGRNGTAKLGSRRKEEFPPRRHQLMTAKREMDNVGVYPLTLIRWLTGRRWQTVYCVTGNYFFEQHQKHNVEDFGMLTCTMDEGLPVTITSGRYGWTSHPSFGVNRIALIGSERTILIDPHRPRLEVYTTETPWQPPAVHAQDPMAFWSSTQAEVHTRPKNTWVHVTPANSDVAYFLDRLDKKRDSELNVEEAVLSTEVLVAGYRSAATRQLVKLPLGRS